MKNVIRFYNGPQSPLMDKIYDRLIEHTDICSYSEWSIISLYLARVIAGIHQYDIPPDKCTCWRCMGLKEDPYPADEPDEPVELHVSRYGFYPDGKENI